MTRHFNFAWVWAALYGVPIAWGAVLVAREMARSKRRAARAIADAERFQAERGRRDPGWPFSRLLSDEDLAVLRQIEQLYPQGEQETGRGESRGAAK